MDDVKYEIKEAQTSKMMIQGREYMLSVVQPYSPSGKAKPRLNVYEKGHKGIVSTVPYTQKEGVDRANVVRAVLGKRDRGIIGGGPEVTEEDGNWYRVSKVYMVYGNKLGGHTPMPIAEMRIVVYTCSPGRYDTYVMDEYKRQTVRSSDNSLSFKDTRYEIEGYESERVDDDEVESSQVDRPYLYLWFFDRNRNIKSGGKLERYV